MAKNAPKVNIDMSSVRRTVDAATLEGMNAILIALSSAVRATLSQPGTGRLYKAGGGTKSARNIRAQGLHRASAPGQPPAVNTNRLRASWITSASVGPGQRVDRNGGFVSVEKRPNRIVMMYGSSVRYAPFLEFGTRRMKKRPYLARALPPVQRRADAIMARAFQRHFQKGTP